jgi:hypothetical protein
MRRRGPPDVAHVLESQAGNGVFTIATREQSLSLGKYLHPSVVSMRQMVRGFL